MYNILWFILYSIITLLTVLFALTKYTPATKFTSTTAGLMLRFMGWVDDADNSDFASAGFPCLVRFTTHFNADSLGIAVGTPATTGV